MNELNIPFNFGQNNKLPAITGKEFFAVKLENISPEDQQLKGLDLLQLAYSPSDTITNFAFTFEPASRLSDLYAFGNSGIYKLNTIGSSRIYTATTSTDKWAVVPWKDVVYATRPGVPFRKMQGNTTTYIPVTASNIPVEARYAVAAHDKMFLANVIISGTVNSTTVMWSDLYNPENFTVTESTEADSFQLSVDDLEITGLALHRNQVLIFTYNSIWTANYEGLPGVYAFSPLYGGVGNSYHYAVIRVQDRVYFISSSGVYKIDSFQLVEVGAEIWPLLRVDIQGQVNIMASVDERKKLIYWNVGSKTYVYNYEENRWAVYNYIFCTALLSIPGSLRTTEVINNINVTYTSLPSLAIDAGYNTQLLPVRPLIGTNNQIYQVGVGSPPAYTTTIELPSMFKDSVWVEKELTEVKLMYTKTLNPTVMLHTSYQDSFSDAVTTESKAIESGANFIDEAIFKVRQRRVAKLLGIKLVITNTTTDYVNSIAGLSLRFTDGDAER